MQWLLGYLTGVPAGATIARGDIALAETDAAAMEAWVDKYCSEHPLNYVDSAAFELAKELNKRASKGQ